MLTRLPSRVTAFALALVAVVAVNVAQFRTIDENTNARYRALNRSGTADVLVIGYQQSPNFRQRYGLPLALAELAPGSRVVVPAGSAYDGYEWSVRLLGFGKVERVSPASIAGRLDRLLPAGTAGTEFDPSPYLVARGPGGPRGAPWAIALDRPAEPETAEHAERFLRNALRDGHRGGSPGPARELLLVRWYQPEPDSGYDYHHLLVEISLLPEALRTELSR